MNNLLHFPSGLHSSSWKKRAQTLESFGINNDDINQLFPILFASLYDQEPAVRMIAVHFLEKKIPNEIILSHLQNLFSAEERQIRFSAIIAAEVLSKEYLIPLLNRIDEDDPEIKGRIQYLIDDLDH